MLVLRLSLITGGNPGLVYEADRDVVRVGRATDNDLEVTGKTVAPHHARLVMGANTVLLEELESVHGTRILRNGTPETVDALAPAVLQSGDVIELGKPGESCSRLNVSIEQTDGDPLMEARGIETLSSATRSAERSADLLFALQQAQQAIAGATHLNGVLICVADSALSLAPAATHATLILRDETRSGLDAFVPIVTRAKDSGAPHDTPKPIPATRSVVRKVLRDQAAVLAKDAQKETVSSESLLFSGIRSTVGVPLWLRRAGHDTAHEIIGVLQVDNRSTSDALKPADLDVLGALAANASLAVANARLIQRLASAESRLAGENAFLKKRDREQRPTDLVGDAKEMTALVAQIDRVASTKAPVLIEGETGVGKERVAALLHERSDRGGGLFVVQNCAAIPDNLLESELFGHQRGAFTGADREKKGLFEIADGGTLFLDEVGDLPFTLQPKLLRALQEGEVRRIGDSRTRAVNVRVVSATNKDLQTEVSEGRFREDLFYRLSVFPIRVPPLRERKSDIPLLAGHFLERYMRELGKPIAGFSEAAMQLLIAHAWPGNVRELENEVQRLVIQADKDTFIAPELLSERVRQLDQMLTRAAVSQTGNLKDRMTQMERYLVTAELRRVGGNKTQAAKALGITREGLHKKLRSLGL